MVEGEFVGFGKGHWDRTESREMLSFQDWPKLKRQFERPSWVGRRQRQRCVLEAVSKDSQNWHSRIASSSIISHQQSEDGEPTSHNECTQSERSCGKVWSVPSI